MIYFKNWTRTSENCEFLKMFPHTITANRTIFPPPPLPVGDISQKLLNDLTSREGSECVSYALQYYKECSKEGWVPAIMNTATQTLPSSNALACFTIKEIDTILILIVLLTEKFGIIDAFNERLWNTT